MKNELLTSALILFFLFTGISSNSQDYDLIVTTKGDSIACRIDSISDTHIYYEMRSQGAWIDTHINKSSVSDYKRNAIIRNEFVFKSGTSIIKNKKPAYPLSMWDVRKNSVYIGILSLNYARMLPVGDHVGITFGGGLYHFEATGVVVESSVLLGGVKHFFEPGVMGVYFLFDDSQEQEEESGDGAASIRVGYRYQGPGGLLLRAAPNFIFFDGDFFVWCALSVGYSF